MLALPGVIFSLIFTSPNYFLIDTKENYDEADLIIQTVTDLDKGLQIPIKFVFQMLDIDDKYWSNWRNETFVKVTNNLNVTKLLIQENLGLLTVATFNICHFNSFHNIILAEQDDIS